MRQSDRAFRAQRERSKIVEIAVSNWLQQRGGYVLPAYDYSGLQDDKAPRLSALARDGSLVIPDLLHARAGRSIWIEVKLKESASFTRITQRLETGLSRRLWDHYLRVEEVTGIPVWLVFVHEQEAEMRGLGLKELVSLGPRFYSGTAMGRHGMVFVPWEKLRLIATWAELGVEAVAAAQLRLVEPSK